MARKEKTEMGFGSDSFLDILCNMVGILVILIVIAGMRVNRAPVVLPDLAGTQELGPPTVLDDPLELGEPETMVWAVEAPPPAPVPDLPKPAKPAPLAPLDPPQELVKATSSMQVELDVLSAELAAVETESDTLTARTAKAKHEVAAVRALVSGAVVDQKSAAELALLEQQDLATLQSHLATLETELREARASAPKVKVLKHSTTPVSRLVNGSEVHFRLTKNTVSVVPVDMLVERLQAQIQRQRENVD